MSGVPLEIAESAARRRSASLALTASVFAASLYVFARDLQAIGAINDWWRDELFSLWLTDPGQRLADAFWQRILPDSNPPLYYIVLYWTRQVVSDARSAATLLNLAALTAAVLSVLRVSKRTGTLPLGLIGCAAFLLSGPVLRYTAEARAYLPSLALTFLASWLAASAILCPRRPPAWVGFALLGALSAVLHLYSALLCCCLAAGMFVVAWRERRSDLGAASFALGVPAGAIALAWLAYARAAGSFAGMSWIPSSLTEVMRAGGEVVLLAFPVGVDIATVDAALHDRGEGVRAAMAVATPGVIALALILAIFCLGLANRRLRGVSQAFGVCFLLFFALPVAASFKQPIIVGRYWMIGAPAAIVLLLFLIRGWLDELGDEAPARKFSLGAAAAAIAFVGWTTLNGLGAARALVLAKPVWSGGQIVSSLGKACPPRSIHVLIHYPTSRSLSVDNYSYAFMSNRPEDAFAPVIADRANGRDYPPLDEPSCPVLGWAEHAVPDVIHVELNGATDQELLRLLLIDAPISEVEILRHRKGYVVLRRNP